MRYNDPVSHKLRFSRVPVLPRHGSFLPHSLIIVLLVVTLLRIPSLFEPYWYGDEGIYLTLGMAVQKGLTLYRDIHDNKPPFLYLVAALAGTQFWFKLILMAWHLTTTVIFFHLARVLFPKHPRAPLVGTIAFAAFTMLPEGNIANGEIFMILPIIIGMIGIWTMQQRSLLTIDSPWLPFATGVSFALGALFKIPAAIDFAGAVAFLLFVSSGTLRETVKKAFHSSTFILIVGFSIPIALSILYYAVVGGVEPYLRSALLQNIGYLGSWKTGAHETQSLSSSGLLIRTILLGVGVIALWTASVRLRFSMPLRLIATWFLFALYGAVLSERPYPHYLIEPAVPAALLVTALAVEKQRVVKASILVLGVVATVVYLKIKFWQYPVASYYENFWRWFTKQQSTEQYFSYFGEQINQTYQIATYVRTTTMPDDRIFVWGDHPYIYALAHRLPVGRFTVAYHVVDFNAYEETLTEIERDPPRVIILMRDESRPFPALAALVKSQYILANQIDEASIYRLLSRHALVY